MRRLQRPWTVPVLLLAGVLTSTTGCGLWPQGPTLTASQQSVTVLSGGEEVRLGVSYDAEGPIILQWAATGGTVLESAFKDSVSNTWRAPYCIPEGAPLPVVTVTLTDEEGRTASAEFHFQESASFRCVVTETAPMGRARVGHTATQLASGKVLVVGGVSEYTTTRTPNSTGVTPTTCEASAELFEPSTGTWTSTGALNHPRSGHQAHLLPSGKVLVVGGGSCSGVGDSYQWKESITVELYEPSTGTWTVASEKSELTSLEHSLLLASGKLLLLGYGWNALYDPEANTWSPATVQYDSSVAGTLRLPSGKVLTVGTKYLPGDPRPTPIPFAWLYDPATDTWSATGPLNAQQTFVPSALSLLPSGKVLLIYYLQGPLGAELYEPEANTWTTTATPPSELSASFAATLLPTGGVLVTHGNPDWKLKLFDPATETWTVAGHMPVLIPERITVTTLSSGQTLLVGGVFVDDEQPSSTPQSKAWLYSPRTP